MAVSRMIARAQDAATVLRCEAELQQIAEQTGQEFVWLWEVSSPVVVVGRSGNIEREANTAACQSDGIPILRRESGGGTVLLAQGCLNYSLILNLEQRLGLSDVARSYGQILRAIIDAAQEPGLRLIGSDLTFQGKKVGGSSQKRCRRTLLHHGTILYDFDVALAVRYLQEPPRQPDYRQQRSHADFLTNLPLDPDAFAARFLEGGWSDIACERERTVEGAPDSHPELKTEHYCSFRRTGNALGLHRSPARERGSERTVEGAPDSHPGLTTEHYCRFRRTGNALELDSSPACERGAEQTVEGAHPGLRSNAGGSPSQYGPLA